MALGLEHCGGTPHHNNKRRINLDISSPLLQSQLLIMPSRDTIDRDAMDTFRAIVQVEEKSTRGLTITEVLIRLNPGHYSIWYVSCLLCRYCIMNGLANLY